MGVAVHDKVAVGIKHFGQQPFDKRQMFHIDFDECAAPCRGFAHFLYVDDRVIADVRQNIDGAVFDCRDKRVGRRRFFLCGRAENVGDKPEFTRLADWKKKHGKTEL